MGVRIGINGFGRIGRQFLKASQDLYQWFLMISTHSQRHIMQIREVKAHKDFPKK